MNVRLSDLAPEYRRQARAKLRELAQAPRSRHERTRGSGSVPIAAVIASESVVLTIDEIAPSLNRTKGQHWIRYRKLRKRWDWLIGAAMLEGGIVPKRFALASVHILRQTSRLCDPDSLVGCHKCVIDSLRANSLIEDDSPDHIDLTVDQRIGRPSRTIITIRKGLGIVDRHENGDGV